MKDLLRNLSILTAIVLLATCAMANASTTIYNPRTGERWIVQEKIEPARYQPVPIPD